MLGDLPVPDDEFKSQELPSDIVCLSQNSNLENKNAQDQGKGSISSTQTQSKVESSGRPRRPTLSGKKVSCNLKHKGSLDEARHTMLPSMQDYDDEMVGRHGRMYFECMFAFSVCVLPLQCLAALLVFTLVDLIS